MNNSDLRLVETTVDAAVSDAVDPLRDAIDARFKRLEVPAEAFGAALGLIALIVDAPACRARLLELQRTIDKATDAAAKLAADTAVHAAKVAADNTDLDTREAALRQREVKLRGEQAAMAETARIRAGDLTAIGRRPGQFIEGSTISQG